MNHIFDVAIVGGGINGCGCAADAALRGLSVVLFEKDDLASKTSSSSTKLIHGGLRYLENYEFGLVKKALKERQILLDVAPHLVHPQAFVLPYQKHMRPAWFLKLGLFLYDHLSRSNLLPKSKAIHRNVTNFYFNPLIDKLKRGLLFYDGSTDDSRLTIANALQAKNHGASIRPHSAVIDIQTFNNLWELTIQPQNGPIYTIQSKSLINAAGPWVKSIAKLSQISNSREITLVKGSHIIVPKIYEGEHAYFLQHDDKRVIFVIPYHHFSMIGTTDIEFTGEPDQVHISTEEINYLTNLTNSYFKKKINQEDIVFSWSGLRPLLAADGKEMRSISRDYSYELSMTPAPVVTIYGGKITTYRQLAEEIVNQLAPLFLNTQESKTKHSPLPGAVFNKMNFADYLLYAKKKYSWLEEELLHRYLYSYGTCMEVFLGKCTSRECMGEQFGPSLYQAEVDYLISEEWAKDCEDILLRRTKLGLTMDLASQKKLVDYLNAVKSNQLANATNAF